MRWPLLRGLLSATVVWAAVACARTPPPSAEPVGAEPVAQLPELPPPAPPEAIPSASTVFVEVVEGTGIPICDEYLELYARCEQHLMPEIMAGNRRFHHAEEASLRHWATQPEAATLSGSCQSMLEALRVDCPEQNRQPP